MDLLHLSRQLQPNDPRAAVLQQDHVPVRLLDVYFDVHRSGGDVAGVHLRAHLLVVVQEEADDW